jgi:hypothetical protein
VHFKIIVIYGFMTSLGGILTHGITVNTCIFTLLLASTVALGMRGSRKAGTVATAMDNSAYISDLELKIEAMDAEADRLKSEIAAKAEVNHFAHDPSTGRRSDM